MKKFEPPSRTGISQRPVGDRGCLCGRLSDERIPMRIGAGLPIFAEDLQKIKQSWRFLLERGVATVYPAHGKPFSVDAIRRALS